MKFSREEIRQVRGVYRRLIGEVKNVRADQPGIVKATSIPRLMRALYWVQTARRSSVGERIASYCTAMEGLVATSASELSHQLAERMAIFLADVPAERIQTFKQIKTAYKYRSKVVHGDVMKTTKASELTECAKQCDELIRAALWKAITDNDAFSALESSNEAIDLYFLRKIFGFTGSDKM